METPYFSNNSFKPSLSTVGRYRGEAYQLYDSTAGAIYAIPIRYKFMNRIYNSLF